MTNSHNPTNKKSHGFSDLLTQRRRDLLAVAVLLTSGSAAWPNHEKESKNAWPTAIELTIQCQQQQEKDKCTRGRNRQSNLHLCWLLQIQVPPNAQHPQQDQSLGSNGCFTGVSPTSSSVVNIFHFVCLFLLLLRFLGLCRETSS